MAYYIRTLSTVLGSEEAAKKAFVVAYGDGDGFTAVNLTPDQAHQISSKFLFAFFVIIILINAYSSVYF